MTEAESYRTYHVLMERQAKVLVGPRFLKVARLWGVDFELGHWESFDGEVLRRRYGNSWPKQLQRALDRGLFRIDGEDARERHELRRDELSAVPEVAERQVAERAVRSRSGRNSLGVLVRHIRDVDEVTSYEDLLDLLEQSGLSSVRAWLGSESSLNGRADRLARLRKAYSNGRGTHELACPYCAAGTLPQPLGGLLTTYLGRRSE